LFSTEKPNTPEPEPEPVKEPEPEPEPEPQMPADEPPVFTEVYQNTVSIDSELILLCSLITLVLTQMFVNQNDCRLNIIIPKVSCN